MGLVEGLALVRFPCQPREWQPVSFIRESDRPYPRWSNLWHTMEWQSTWMACNVSGFSSKEHTISRFYSDTKSMLPGVFPCTAKFANNHVYIDFIEVIVIEFRMFFCLPMFAWQLWYWRIDLQVVFTLTVYRRLTRCMPILFATPMTCIDGSFVSRAKDPESADGDIIPWR